MNLSPRYKKSLSAIFLVALPLLLVLPVQMVVSDVTQAQTAQDRNAEAERLFTQGQQFTKAGQYQKAIDSLQQSLAIVRQIGNTQAEPTLVLAIGANYVLLRDVPNGREYLLQSIELAKKTGDQETEAKATDVLSKISQ